LEPAWLQVEEVKAGLVGGDQQLAALYCLQLVDTSVSSAWLYLRNSGLEKTELGKIFEKLYYFRGLFSPTGIFCGVFFIYN
jgi:hypothetical protein